MEPSVGPVERDALKRLLSEARRATRAEAGTVYLREGDQLCFAAVQNDVLAQRVGAAEAEGPLDLSMPSLASYVMLTRAVVNVPDVYEIGLERPYEFDRRMDATHGYRTRSMLVMPLRDGRGTTVGVVQLINARNEAGEVVAFDAGCEDRLAALLTGFAKAGGS